MKNILLVGDPHFKVSNSLETSQFSEETYNYVLKNKKTLDFVVILGDVLDTHEKIHVQPLCRAVKFIKKLSEIILVYVLIGNHDRINNNVFLTEEHPFSGLKKLKNIVIVDKVLTFEKFIFVPYVSNGRFEEALETVNFNQTNCECIFAHQEFRGCKMGAMMSETGDIWPENFPTVFSGHIHDFQQPQKNILYTGTPFQHGFADNTDKFLIKLNFKNRDEWGIEKILIDVVKKKSLNVNALDLEDLKIPKNIILKLIITGDSKIVKKILLKENVKDKLNNPMITYTVKNEISKEKTLTIDYTKNNFFENLNKKIENCEENLKLLFKEIFN